MLNKYSTSCGCSTIKAKNTGRESICCETEREMKCFKTRDIIKTPLSHPCRCAIHQIKNHQNYKKINFLSINSCLTRVKSEKCFESTLFFSCFKCTTSFKDKHNGRETGWHPDRQSQKQGQLSHYFMISRTLCARSLISPSMPQSYHITEWFIIPFVSQHTHSLSFANLIYYPCRPLFLICSFIFMSPCFWFCMILNFSQTTTCCLLHWLDCVFYACDKFKWLYISL